MRRGKLIGVGVGPGDPDLLTLKAVQALQSAQAIAFIAAAGRTSRAREIASRHIRPGTRELIAVMPMTLNSTATGRAYDQLMTGILSELSKGQDVLFLCEGDPLLYGSFAHLLPRLGTGYECEVIPGVSSIGAAAAAARLPLGIYEEPIALVPATMAADQMAAMLSGCDRVVVMKVGRHLARIKEALAAAGMLEEAVLIENVTLQAQRIRPLAMVTEQDAPYFSLIIAGRKRAGPA
jgi:precorrin-2/cobalt-factor-2 C20-methyltransferase